MVIKYYIKEKQQMPNEDIATNTHYKVGKAIRETIKKLGGTMPEDLPTPKKSIKELEKEKAKKLTNKEWYNMEKFIYYNELYLIYKDLLSENAQEIFDLYYGDNLTMQEIADNKNISKARVGVIIKNVEKKLDALENALKIYELRKELNEVLELNDINEIKNRLNNIVKGE